MNMLSSFLTLNCPCEEALRWSNQSLTESGWRVLQTFDLHTARHGLEECPCPHHGTSECDCQMFILLVYGEAMEPVTLMLHGNDGQTWLSIAEDPNQETDRKMISDIQEALKVQAPVSISQSR